jgi:hypothetical protein
MFGCPADQNRSFSETFTLVTSDEDDDDDDGSGTTLGRVLTAEELIERFKNREDIFLIDENIKFHSSEIITFLCVILVCSTYDKEFNAKHSKWISGLFTFSHSDKSSVDTMRITLADEGGDRVADLFVQSQMFTSGHNYYQKIYNIAFSNSGITEKSLNLLNASWTGYNKKNSLVSPTLAPRGPPLDMDLSDEKNALIEYMCSLKCKDIFSFVETYNVFSNANVDTEAALFIGSNDCNYTVHLLHLCMNRSSLILQADRGHLV